MSSGSKRLSESGRVIGLGDWGEGGLGFEGHLVSHGEEEELLGLGCECECECECEVVGSEEEEELRM